MLRNLTVRNYALIDSLDLVFEPGLNIITGETGAGKSILLGALSLLLGQRADSAALLDKTRKCVLEATFDADIKRWKAWLEEKDLDVQEQLVLRREINSEGKSRSFINDTPVNLALLKEAASGLVDIHSQHETLLLNQAGFQQDVVDSFAGIKPEAEHFRRSYRDWIRKGAELQAAREAENKSAGDADYWRFQAEEIEAASLVEGEEEQHQAELETLSHAEEIKKGLAQAAVRTDGDGESLNARLAELIQDLQLPARYHGPAGILRDRVRSMQVELRDIAADLEREEAAVSFSPERLEWLNDRLDLVRRLQQKHRVTSVKEVMEAGEKFRQRLAGLQSATDSIVQLAAEYEALAKELNLSADELSRRRADSIPALEKELKRLLKEVALPHASFKVEQEPAAGLTQAGKDRIRFLFSANKGISMQEMSKVASGGELSRLMLCLKSLLARLADLPVMIFDEIDAGISGETAIRVGRMLKEMARLHQVFAITHLPQIAGRGDSHYYVFKETGKTTTTGVRKLTADERIVEVARMLSGEKPSAVALENARELLKMH